MRGKLIMLFNEMYQTAKNIIEASNIKFNENDTICVAYTVSGKVYTGLSSVKYIGSISVSAHAETDLCNSLLKNNDTAVAELALFKIKNLETVFPCSDCILRIISLNSFNTNTVFVLPSENIFLSKTHEYNQNSNNYIESDYLKKYESDESRYLKKRLNSIFNSSDDENDIYLLRKKQLLEKSRQKKKFSFFRRKSDSQ